MARKGFDLAALAREQMGAGMAQSVESVREIPLADIDVNDGNFYTMSDIEALAANIELLGLIHPVAVKPGTGGRWTLIDGERRFRAVQRLGRETIRAVVHRPVSSVFEELMLISANMQQRKLSAADLSKQAERYTECLADLKRSGVNIPGRLRAAVAEALDVSESKLARLAAIRSKLIPEALARFDEGAINESVAYSLSRIPAEYQPTILADEKYLQSWRVDLVADNLDEFINPNCMEGTTSCRAARVRYVLDSGYVRCSGECCLSCACLTLCGGGCDRARTRAEEKRAAADAAAVARAVARKAERTERCRETTAAWDWYDGDWDLPGPSVRGTICCWGKRGFRTVKVEDYEAAREAFPGEFDWWCEPVPPREFKSNIGEDDDE